MNSPNHITRIGNNTLIVIFLSILNKRKSGKSIAQLSLETIDNGSNIKKDWNELEKVCCDG